MQMAGRNKRAAMGFVRERTEVSSFGARSNGNIRPIRQMHMAGGSAMGVPAALAGKLLCRGLVKGMAAKEAEKDSPYEGVRDVKPLAYFIVYIPAEGNR
jgi:hypothetical protein